MVSKTAVAMFSHVDREEMRSATLEAFLDVGAPVDHVELSDGTPRQAKVRRGAWGAMKHLTQLVAPKHETVGVLIIEDDIEPSPLLPSWIEFLEGTENRPVTLYVTPRDYLYPLRLRRVARGEREATKPEVATLADITHWWGSQAVWMPLWFAKEVVRDDRMQVHESGLGPWDHALRTILQEKGMTLGCTFPGVVQHLAPRNMVLPKRKPHVSASFSREVAPPARNGDE